MRRPRDLSEQWYPAWLDKDAATVERLMADDYVYVAPSGQAQARVAILRVIHTPSYRLRKFNRTDIVIRPLGDTAAVVRSRERDEGEFDGKHFEDDHALLQVWSRVGRDWMVVLEQATARSAE
jgi:ketosteroid isomerase-like protein